MNSGEPGYSFSSFRIGGESKRRQAIRGKSMRKYLGGRTTS